MNQTESSIATDLAKTNGKDTAPLVVSFSSVDTQPAVAAYSVVRLVPTDPSHRKIFPQIVDRAIGFIDRIGAETCPIWLGNLLYSHFQQGSNTVHVVGGFDANGKLIGHSVSYVENRHKLGNVIILLQLEKDEGDASLLKIGMNLIEAWALSIGVKTILNESDSRARSRLWERYGYTEYRITSRKDLKG